MTWQALISGAAATAFDRTGRLLSFRLARGDLVALAAELGGIDDQLRSTLLEQTGHVAMRCLVWCEPLGRQIVVDEWH